MNAAVQVISEAGDPTKRNIAAATTPHANTGNSRPALKQITINWNLHDKYSELLIFEMKVKIIFMT